MSHSDTSDSSVLESTFLVGTELVEFDRRELPIYATPQTRLMDACFDEVTYGAPLDRVFGEPGVIHIDGAVPGSEHQQQATVGVVIDQDPLVSLAALADGLTLSTDSSCAPELATHFDFGADAHAIVHLHDGIGWDLAGADGLFDFQA